jgi:hypothetical protein
MNLTFNDGHARPSGAVSTTLADRRKSHRRQQRLESSADDIVFTEVAN